LTPDSIQQKYAQAVASTWIAPGCVQSWGRKNVFTRPGSKAEVELADADFRFTPESGLKSDIGPCRFAP
jgi:hypothetical protein